MLSNKLWRWLEYRLSFQRAHQNYGRLIVPHADDMWKQPLRLTGFVLLPWICVCTAFPYLIIPLTTTIICTQVAWGTSSALTRLYDLGRRELLSLTPIGFWNISQFIGGNFAESAITQIPRRYVFGVLVGTLIFVMIGISGRTIAGLMSTALIEVALAVSVYVDFRQVLSLSFVVSVASSQIKARSGATALAIAGLVMAQTISYLLWFVVFYMTTFAFYLVAIGDAILFAISICTATGVVLLAREIVIYALWRWLVQQVNDDPPLLQNA
ncbi:MAG: hypothetical protein U0694_08840 [Anaerolineae bacterium]